MKKSCNPGKNTISLSLNRYFCEKGREEYVEIYCVVNRYQDITRIFEGQHKKEWNSKERHQREK